MFLYCQTSSKYKNITQYYVILLMWLTIDWYFLFHCSTDTAELIVPKKHQCTSCPKGEWICIYIFSCIFIIKKLFNCSFSIAFQTKSSRKITYRRATFCMYNLREGIRCEYTLTKPYVAPQRKQIIRMHPMWKIICYFKRAWVSSQVNSIGL